MREIDYARDNDDILGELYTSIHAVDFPDNDEVDYFGSLLEAVRMQHEQAATGEVNIRITHRMSSDSRLALAKARTKTYFLWKFTVAYFLEHLENAEKVPDSQYPMTFIAEMERLHTGQLENRDGLNNYVFYLEGDANVDAKVEVEWGSKTVKFSWTIDSGTVLPPDTDFLPGLQPL